MSVLAPKLSKLKILIISISVFIGVCLFSFPVYLKISHSVQKFVSAKIEQLQQEFSVKFSYQRISPAIFSGIRIYGISFFAYETEDPILTIKSVKLNYHLDKILCFDFENAFDEFVIYGTTLEFEKAQKYGVVDKIRQILEASDKNKSDKNKNDKKEKKTFSIPFAFRLVDTRLVFESDKLNAFAEFKNIRLAEGEKIGDKNSVHTSQNENSDFFVANLKGMLSVTGKNSIQKLGNVLLDFSLLGSVTRSLDEFEMRLRINSAQGKNFTIKAQQYICRYSSSILNLTSGLNDIDFSMDLTCDLKNQQLVFQETMKDFSPADIVTFKNGNSAQKIIDGIKISSDVNFLYSMLDKKMLYSAQGFAKVDDNFDYGNMNVLVDISGDEKNLSIPTISVDSSKLSLDLSLDCDLQNLQPTGTFFLNHYELKNGNSLSFEMYFDKLAKGFMCFVPQFNFGQQFFTAMELDVIPEEKSVDYQFSIYDYMHQDSGTIGKLLSEGSLILEGKPYVQSSISLDSLYFDSVIKSLEFFLDDSYGAALIGPKNFLSSWIMSTEFFVSTDFSGISYNVPYVVLADTKKDGSMILASVSGTEENSQISQLNVLYAGQELNLNLDCEYPDGFSQVLFNSSFSFNSLPYSLSGSFEKGKELLVSGDYGFTFDLLFPKQKSGTRKKTTSAQLKLDMLPLRFNNKFFSVSFDGKSNFVSKNDWNIDFDRIEIIDSSTSKIVSPHLSFVGNVNNEGMMWKNIVFVDSSSMLSGTGTAVWTITDTSFDSLNFSFLLDNDTTLEKLNFEGIVSNPSGKKFKQMDVLTDIFCSLMVSVERAPLSRFLANQKSGNMLNLEANVLGPIGNPGISFKMQDTSAILSGKNVKVDLDAHYEEGVLSLLDTNLVYDTLALKSLHGDFDLQSFNGMFDSNFAGNFIAHDFKSPVHLSVESRANQVESAKVVSVGESSILNIKIPEKIKIHLLFDSLSCESFKVQQSLGITVKTQKGKIEFSSDDEIVTGSVLNGTNLKIDVAQNKRFSFNLLGTIGEPGLNLDISNFYLDFEHTSNFFNFPYFHGKGGIGQGELKVAGSLSDLDFYGRIDVDNLLFTCPDYLTEDLFVKKTAIVADDNIFAINRFAAKTHSGGYIDGDVSTEIENGAFAWWKVYIKTRGDSTGKARFAYQNLDFEGNVKVDLDILATMKEGVSVKGSIFGENVTGTFSLTGSSSSSSSDTLTDVKSYFSKFIDLDITIGPKCYVQAVVGNTPMLKALVNPNTPAKFQIDSDSGYFNFESDLNLRGGSIVALTRSFYLREGRLLFSGGKIDPFITVRGEMRENDSDGNPVRIYLSAVNQRLSNFNPIFTSSPAKSESEIMILLGQFSSDETGETNASDMAIHAIAGGVNYLGQSFIISKVENALRDFFKFDIFSLHPTILQNAVIVNSDSTKEQNVGNYLNGSSVYIGKYIGNNMYLDALLNLEYMEGLVDSKKNIYGLKVEPEFGFEIESPFAFIRWSVAPDLTSLKESWVPGTSLSLSWKFYF